MREILFRGKRTDNGEWVKGFYVKTCNDFDRSKFYHWIYIGFVGVTINGLENVKFEVDPETVGQYTGLKDKNGKRIFEGDIIYDDEIFFANFEVFYSGENCKFYGLNFNDRDQNTLSFPQLSDTGTIIGNRWDNPELLEVQ